jgi:hypothetical protein
LEEASPEILKDFGLAERILKVQKQSDRNALKNAMRRETGFAISARLNEKLAFAFNVIRDTPSFDSASCLHCSLKIDGALL